MANIFTTISTKFYHSWVVRSHVVQLVYLGRSTTIGQWILSTTATLKHRAMAARSRHSAESCWWPRRTAATASQVRVGVAKTSASAKRVLSQRTTQLIFRFTLLVSAALLSYTLEFAFMVRCLNEPMTSMYEFDLEDVSVCVAKWSSRSRLSKVRARTV